MNKFTILSLLAGATLAQNNVFFNFGSCENNACATGKECCEFDDIQGQVSRFCMNEQQKGGKWSGTYTDSDLTIWNWKCKSPEQKKADALAAK